MKNLNKNILVLIADDDSFSRIFLRGLLESHPDIAVVGEAEDGAQAVEMAEKLKPDIITMDVSMPGMNGLEATAKIMARSPRPILLVSELTQEASEATLKGLELGAVDFLSKSSNHLRFDIPHVKEELVEKILYWAKPHARKAKSRFIPRAISPAGAVDLVLIAVATGGPQMLPNFFGPLQSLSCPMVLAQVMPAMFTEPFVARLQSKTALRVVTGSSGMILEPGVIHVAPGGMDVLVHGGIGGKLLLDVKRLADSDTHPSARALFESAANAAKNGVAVVLTGKSRQVAKGAKKIFQKGWPVLVQDPTTCVVDRSSRAVLEAESATEILSPEEIGQRVAFWTS